MPDDKSLPSFEQSLAELETIVRQLESGESSLEEALQAFERGVQLTRQCQSALDAAEQKVKLLTEQADGSISSKDFDNGES